MAAGRDAQIVRQGGPAAPPGLVSGYVSTSQPAPAGFGDLMQVVMAGHSPDLSVPCAWGAIHGASLPAQGAAVLVAFNDQGVPVVVWWAGTHT